MYVSREYFKRYKKFFKKVLKIFYRVRNYIYIYNMKQNPNKFYVSVEDTVYSLTGKQYKKVVEMIDKSGKDFDGDKEQFYKALDYIMETGRKILIMDESYRY